jgi:hypothetical protein
MPQVGMQEQLDEAEQTDSYWDWALEFAFKSPSWADDS